MRLQDRPTFRAVGQRHLRRRSPAGAEAARAIAQAGLYPGQLPPARSGRGRRSRAPAPGDEAVLLLAFESADHAARRLDGARARVRARPRRSRARRTPARTRTTDEGAREGAAGAWRRAFLDAPYLRNAIVAPRHGERDLRDRRHLGSLRRRSTRR